LLAISTKQSVAKVRPPRRILEDMRFPSIA
jgi:hypothetical protein